jgi:hypothetical protein
MVTSKIVLLLRNFTKDDINRFGEYLDSPYFNTKKKLVQFYAKLIKYHPGFEEAKINREKIYESLYPGSKFNPQVYKNLSSELYQHAREFLAVKSFSLEPFESDLRVVKHLEEISSNELYRIELKSLKKKLAERKTDDFIFFERFRLASVEKQYFFNRSNYKKGNELSVDEGNELVRFFFFHMFRLIFDQEVSKNNFNALPPESAYGYFAGKLIESGVLKETVDYFERKKIKDHEVIQMLYYIVISMIHLENEEYFDRAKKLVFANLNRFSEGMRYIISSSLLTISAFKINSRGSKSDMRNAFEIIQFLLKKKIYKETPESYVTATEFRSMFMIGMNLMEYNWLKWFTRKHLSDVTPAQQPSLRFLLTGMICFVDKDYDSALENLSKVKFDIFAYKLDVKRLQLMIFYEQGHLEEALSLISAYREFVSTNRNITPETKKRNLEFLNFVSCLIRLKNNPDDDSLENLETELRETSPVLYRSWFEEKVNELRKT